MIFLLFVLVDVISVLILGIVFLFVEMKKKLGQDQPALHAKLPVNIVLSVQQPALNAQLKNIFSTKLYLLIVHKPV